jgi:hypothetical protein
MILSKSVRIYLLAGCYSCHFDASAVADDLRANNEMLSLLWFVAGFALERVKSTTYKFYR